MKEALQKVEAEEQSADTKNSEPVQGFSKFFLTISDTTKSMLLKAAISGSLVASQAIYRAFRKTIENKQNSTPSTYVTISNPLD